MPVTNSANSRQIIRGPGWLYADVDVPLSNAEVALTAGVPSTGFLMGYTDAGTAIISSAESQDEMVDESATPVDTTVANEVFAFEVGLLQLANSAMFKYIFPTGTVVTTPATGVNFGGQVRIPDSNKHSYLLVWQNDDGTYAHAMLYKAIQTNEMNLKVSRVERMVANARFTGQADATRTQGDYVGRIRWTTVPAATLLETEQAA